ncbi:protein mini spindles isoform X1 [Athalia rosae]|uniref:protein mini spindles isoform X1 n=1 Tax=Athalia rosae TaxID=37344 RepID=UPI00203415D3|nr:protein mini spindles isoform X1 [Athalia rosae]
MEEDTEYTKLSVEDRCVHKLWKARLHGYEECANIFRRIDDEKSPEWNKFLGLVKKFVTDSNAVAQEKGLEAVLAYVENAAAAGKTVGEVMSGIVSKCIAAPRTKTKDLAIQVTLMYIEIEKHEAVQEELLKGTEAKNPKIVAACIATLTLALREFGSRVIGVKPLIKKMPNFLEDRDKAVREEGKLMIVEIYRWIGVPLKQQLNTLKQVQITELETEFNKLKGEKVGPNRYLKSQKPKVTCVVDSADVQAEGDEEVEDDVVAQDIDPYELLDPVDILSKLPKDFYENVEAKKWQDRKEAIEFLENLCKNPKLESGDYGDVVRALKKIISKDSNVLVVALAGKCLAGLANGLKKRFQPYALACLPAIFEKFREKKQNVVQALREAADAIYLSTNIEAILEDVSIALENKNPSVKAETAAFVARCFARTPPTSLNKKLLKAYTGILIKTLNEPDPTVRDYSADAVGTAMKLVGEKAILPFLADLDNLKMAKIKECSEKAVIIVKLPIARKGTGDRPNTAPAKIESPSKLKDTDNLPPPKSKRSNATATKKPATKKPSVSSMTNLAPKKSSAKVQIERNLSSEEIDDLAAQILPLEVLSGLGDGNWKIRLAAVQQLIQVVQEMDTADVSTQVVVRTLAKKPGFKDTNFQVLRLRLETVKMLAETYNFSSIVAEYCVMDISEKLGDAKNSNIAGETLFAIAEATSLDSVANEVMGFAFNQKNPKVQQETLLWLTRAVEEFGFVINVKTLMENIKKAVSATNSTVRTAAISLLGTLYVYMGKPLLMYFDNEKPALKQQIDQECEKRFGETPSAPKRGSKGNRRNVDEDDDGNIDGKESLSEVDVADLMPRVDISNQLTESLLNELCDKNWKVRNEGLQKINTILNDAKFIKGSIGELPQGLALRLVDSNSKIAQSTLGVCQTLATAMGSPAKQHIRTLFPGFLQCLGDSKTWIRTAAISCMNTWGDECGYKEFFEGEMIGDALRTGSPTLRSELWNWLTQKLPLIPVKQIPKEELLVCLPHLFNNLEDRNSDVRKNAQEAVLGYMIHLSYETMARSSEKLKPGSKSVVLAALDKSRPNLPVKPLPKKQPVESTLQQKTVKSGGALKAGRTTIKTKAGNTSKPGSARKKDDDIDTSPLLATNNLKHQRVIDEQKMKVLKWNFTTPREEFVELLKELMTAASVNKTLMANMFHSDFRYHLKAIESLTEDLSGNSQALVSNLDLILKWLTLRFFDTNPSVLLKGLDYLQTVFNILIDDEYHMLENEAASFIPYLVTKIGDPKDAVRNGVRALFKQIALVFPVSKLFSYVMEGIKSKNARQRTECLDQLGSLIENYGVSVCQPNASVALKEVAKQIADRDNSVRNAALNCIVQAYFLEGERVYKLIGQISEKDQSLLDERIKRAAKNRPTKSASLARIAVPPAASANTVSDDGEADYDEEDEEPFEQESEPVHNSNGDQKNTGKTHEGCEIIRDTAHVDSIDRLQGKMESCGNPQLYGTQSTSENHRPDIFHLDSVQTNPVAVPQLRPKVTGPFGLDLEWLERLESNAPKARIPKLVDISISFLNDPVKPLNTRSASQIIPISPPKLLAPKSGALSPLGMQTGKEDSLELEILALSSTDLQLAIQAFNKMENVLKSHQVNQLLTKEDKFISAVNMQLKILQTYPLDSRNTDVSKCFRNTFMVILSFYDSGLLGRNVPALQLKELVDQLIGLLADNKLDRLNEGDAYIRVVNHIVVKVIDHSNHTTIICVLIKLLHGCAQSNAPPKYEELVMKCLWKIVKMMPNWAADLDYDTILREVHYFFRDYPTTWWRQRRSDTPLRTVKTVLHSMTRVKGNAILNHLSLITKTDESELYSYLIRLIGTLKPDDMDAPSRGISKSGNSAKTPKHLSKLMHQQLSEIFKKIGSRHHTQEGLVQLYDFKLQYPEADIYVQPFLLKSHQYFRDYIEQGLRDINQARKSQPIITETNNQCVTDVSGAPRSPPDDRSTMDPLSRLERLRNLEAQFKPTSPSQSNQT